MLRAVKGSWRVPIGRTYWGRTVLLNLNGGSPHTKVAGVTGSGKSVAMKSMLYYLAVQQSPPHLEVHIIDLKGGLTFAHFELLPHVAGVYRNTEEALFCLCYCVEEMWRRIEEVRQARKAFREDPKFKTIVLMIDEGGEMAPADAIGDEKKLREACMDQLSTLARVGREPGIRIIYGTQRPDRYTLPMTVRSQLENTLCFRVSETHDSKIVLDHEGAEKLPKIPGRMIFKTPAGEIPVQGVYIPDDSLLNWLKGYADLPIDVWGEVVHDFEERYEAAKEKALQLLVKKQDAKPSASVTHTDTSSLLDMTNIEG